MKTTPWYSAASTAACAAAGGLPLYDGARCLPWTAGSSGELGSRVINQASASGLPCPALQVRKALEEPGNGRVLVVDGGGSERRATAAAGPRAAAAAAALLLLLLLQLGLALPPLAPARREPACRPRARPPRPPSEAPLRACRAPRHPPLCPAAAAAGKRCALLGDNLAANAVKNGWSGIVVNGCIRDSDDISRMDLGVKVRGSWVGRWAGRRPDYHRTCRSGAPAPGRVRRPFQPPERPRQLLPACYAPPTPAPSMRSGPGHISPEEQQA